MSDDPDSSPGEDRHLQLDILVERGDWSAAIQNLEASARAAVIAAFRAAGFEKAAELSLCLADDPFLQELNARYRGKDRPTNVLSFPQMDPGGHGPCSGDAVLLGDVVLSLDRLRSEADAAGKPLREHFLHLLVHGTLHLLGHDHEETEEAERMEELERRALARLGISDPYQTTDGKGAASLAMEEAT